MGAPSGAAIDTKTGLVTWTPTAGQLGTEQFAIRVKDDKGGENLQAVNVTVVNPSVNQPPVLTATPRTSARIGAAYFYTLQATDPDNDPLTFTLVNGLMGMKLDKEVMSWTPTANQFGDNNVQVKVSNGQGGSNSQTWTIEVSNQLTNLPPVITSVLNPVTTIQRTYQYQTTAVDSEGDRLL